MSNSSTQIASNLHLVRIPVPRTAPPKPVQIPTNHIAVIDCSGSMYGELPKLRQQLKNKLPMLLKDGDTITLIWFSSRNEFGVLVEGLEVASVKDLSGMNNAIDRFLRPVGLTGFKQPLDEVKAVIGRLSKSNPGSAFSLFFMSDGYDNQWSEREILAASEALAPLLSSATIVEYGWYANRNLLAKMGERVGGVNVFAEGFPAYEPMFEDVMKRRIVGGKKLEVPLSHTPLHGIVFGIDGDDIVTFSSEGGKVLVPERLTAVYMLSEQAAIQVDSDSHSVFGDEKIASHDDAKPLYAALFVLAQRMLTGEVYQVLKRLGDVALIKEFTNCFGKQKYSDFQDHALKCVRYASACLVEGYDPNLVPKEDAYTVVDALFDLSADDGNLFFTNHPVFEYQKVSRGRVQATTVLTEAEQKIVSDLSVKMASSKKPAEIKTIQEEINKIVNAKDGMELKFVAADDAAGRPVSSLTWNESRPNVSILVRTEGTVDLSAYLATDVGKKFNTIPSVFPTSIWRNFTIIRDGILNVKVLPVSLTAATHARLVQNGALPDEGYDPARIYELDLRSLPIINRKMVKAVSAKALFESEFALTKLKAAQKVYNHFAKKEGAKVSAGLVAAYGAEATAWLKELGFTDQGFSPKSVQDEAKDAYIGKELKVSLAGLSSLPKVDDVITKMASPKGRSLTTVQALMVGAIDEYDAFTASISSLPEEKRQELLAEWLKVASENSKKRVREVMRKLAEIKFGVVVGQVWFTEFSSLDENSMDISVDGESVSCKVEMKEIEIKI